MVPNRLLGFVPVFRRQLPGHHQAKEGAVYIYIYIYIYVRMCKYLCAQVQLSAVPNRSSSFPNLRGQRQSGWAPLEAKGVGVSGELGSTTMTSLTPEFCSQFLRFQVPNAMLFNGFGTGSLKYWVYGP